MRTLINRFVNKACMLMLLAIIAGTTVNAQDLLIKNPTGYLVNFGNNIIKGGKVADGKAVVLVLYDVSLFAQAKTSKDTAAVWSKIGKDKNYFWAVGGTVKSVNESSFQFVTKDQFAVNFVNKNLSLFILSNPDGKPANTLVTESIGLSNCCGQSCWGRRGFYMTLTKCLSGKGNCQTCVNCCFPIMSVN